jgi:3-hydroxymyristoyl/3-hydroxydecanoyl-(acyl carrier protein) dehydratase
MSPGARLAPSTGQGHPLSLLVEIMAQGALTVLSERREGGDGGGDGRSLRLAGVDGAKVHAPVVAGDRLTVDARVEGRYGALAKVRCRVERDGETVAEAALLLAG